uniref:RabGEF exchange factor n=1 Tax=Siphoviridae sp. ct0uL16 TaxID=2825299 RepID=A0A8S5Q5Z7_9CAUD|nr:MAG TPA: RabGEF exchange factor [Siphoviridae sp. ct0uL16]
MKMIYAIICADCDEPIKENDEYVSVGGNDYHLY